jgi:nucleoside phosphorylase
MSLLDLERDVGVRGAITWLLTATEFPALLELVYGSHFGEVWLYNNDLAMWFDDKYFAPIYEDKVAGSLSHNIDAVKIIVSKDYEGHVFAENGPSEIFVRRMKRIYELGGVKRLHTFYFGKLEDVKKVQAQLLERIASTHAWVFYTQRNELRSESNYGIALVRPGEYPFRQPDADRHFALAWQMKEEHILASQIQKAFMSCFTSPQLFRYVSQFDPFNFSPAWSEEGKRIGETRQQQPPSRDTLAFGEPAHFAVLSSRPDELTFLKELIGDVKPVPCKAGETRPFDCATIQTNTGRYIKLLLGFVGEGNLVSASKMWDILLRWDPEHVILIGVAGADPSRKRELNIGDVVIGTEIFDYEHGDIVALKKGTRWRFQTRVPNHWLPDDGIRDRALALSGNWPPDQITIPDRPSGILDRPKARPGTIGSGSKILGSPRYFKQIVQKTNSKIATVETEGAGVCCACDIYPYKARKVLVVRGIMDMITPKTRGPIRKQNRIYATRTSGRFVYDLLRSL